MVLIGSRSLGTADEASDYDILAVVPTLSFLGVIRRVHELEEHLAQSHGKKFKISPVPMIRLRFGRGNLLFHKARHEGRVLLGRDLRLLFPDVPLEDLGMDTVYSVFFSGILALLEDLRPSILRQVGQNPIHGSLDRRALKALGYAGQALLLTKAIYELEDTRIRKAGELFKGELEFDRISHALDLGARLRNTPANGTQGRDFWEKTRDDLFRVFVALVRHDAEGEVGSLKEAMRAYSSSASSLTTVNLQYALLNFLINREVDLTFIRNRVRPDRGLHLGLLCLSWALQPDGTVDGSRLEYISRFLPQLDSPTIESLEESWTMASAWVMKHWTPACALMGFGPW